MKSETTIVKPDKPSCTKSVRADKAIVDRLRSNSALLQQIQRDRDIRAITTVAGMIERRFSI